MNSSGLHYKQGTWCTEIRELPWYFLCLEPGSDTYLCQETLYLSESCRGRLMKTTNLQGRPLKFVQHIADTTCISPSPAGPSGSCPLHLLHLCYLSVMTGMPNRSYILKLRSNQCFVCNFLSVPSCAEENPLS